MRERSHFSMMTMRPNRLGCVASTLLRMTVLSAAVVGPLPVSAEDVQIDAPDGLATARPSKPPATPPDAAVPGGLEEVLVTAQKRSERLKDIPAAVQVVSSPALAAANVADLSDLNNLVPSVQLNGTINGRAPTGIRGISSVSSEGTVGIPSGVAVMIDGVPVPSDSFDANNVMGIQSIEVLLGPQSTLGGRTAAAGVINLTTRGPTDSPYAFANSTVTTDREYRFEGFLSGPLIDRVEGSLDAYRRTTPYPITNLTLNQTTAQDVYGARAKLKFAITDDLDLTFMGHDENSVGTGFNFTYTYITPGNTFLFYGSPFTQIGHAARDQSLVGKPKLHEPGINGRCHLPGYRLQRDH